jgi:hypothetical protein
MGFPGPFSESFHFHAQRQSVHVATDMVTGWSVCR